MFCYFEDKHPNGDKWRILYFQFQASSNIAAMCPPGDGPQLGAPVVRAGQDEVAEHGDAAHPGHVALRRQESALCCRYCNSVTLTRVQCYMELNR